MISYNYVHTFNLIDKHQRYFLTLDIVFEKAISTQGPLISFFLELSNISLALHVNRCISMTTEPSADEDHAV